MLWRLYERLVNRNLAAMKRVPLPPELKHVPRIDAVPVRVGKFRESLDADAIAALRSLDLDVLLRFGFGILTGEVLSVPRFGTWSYHHGDPTRFRGAPPGFWEIRHGDPVTGVVLQRLTEALDGGVILHSGWFKTDAASYPRSLDRILFGAAHFIARMLTELRHDPARAATGQPLADPGPVYRYPRNGAVIGFLARSARAWARDQYRSLFRHQQWTVGIVKQPFSRLLQQAMVGSAELNGVDWLPEIKGRFLADPFVTSGTDGDRLFAEEFDWTTGVGHIASLGLPAQRPLRTVDSIRTGLHLSYPYILEDGGERYCVPECAESGFVTLYRWDLERDCWVEHAQLIRAFPALDPTIFKHDGRWWLFCTSADAGANEVLFAWYADELVGEWKPHACNPLKVDIRSARPAGRPILCDGELIRPAQYCATHYGAGIVFNRILKLTPDEFAEEPAGTLIPDPSGAYSAGLHTIGSAGDFTVLDGARWACIPAELKRAVRRKLGRGN